MFSELIFAAVSAAEAVHQPVAQVRRPFHLGVRRAGACAGADGRAIQSFRFWLPDSGAGSTGFRNGVLETVQ